jgi:hypothetical protein
VGIAKEIEKRIEPVYYNQGVVTNYITPWSGDLLQKVTVPRLVNEVLTWNPKFHCHVHKRLTVIPVVSQMNPIHIFH